MYELACSLFNSQPVLINMRINNMTLHFPIACNAYAKVQFCVYMIRQTFPLTLVESRCVQIPRSIFYGSVNFVDE